MTSSSGSCLLAFVIRSAGATARRARAASRNEGLVSIGSSSQRGKKSTSSVAVQHIQLTLGQHVARAERAQVGKDDPVPAQGEGQKLRCSPGSEPNSAATPHILVSTFASTRLPGVSSSQAPAWHDVCVREPRRPSDQGQPWNYSDKSGSRQTASKHGRTAATGFPCCRRCAVLPCSRAWTRAWIPTS